MSNATANPTVNPTANPTMNPDANPALPPHHPPTGPDGQPKAGDGTRISGSTVSNAGSACLSVHGNGLSVDGNTVFGCGGPGVTIASGDVKTLASGKSEVVGNTIRDFSLKIRTYQPGIAFYNCVGLRVAHNDVSNGPHTAMTGGGTSLSGPISTVLTGLSWICVGIHSRRALPSPVCA